MSKVAFFGHISPNFYDDFFIGTPKFFSYPQNFLPPENFSGSPNFFTLLDLKSFFRLFRPKNPFLDLKNFSNRLNSLQKHLLNLQSDEKNYIFNFSIYKKKLP